MALQVQVQAVEKTPKTQVQVLKESALPPWMQVQAVEKTPKTLAQALDPQAPWKAQAQALDPQAPWRAQRAQGAGAWRAPWRALHFLPSDETQQSDESGCESGCHCCHWVSRPSSTASKASKASERREEAQH